MGRWSCVFLSIAILLIPACENAYRMDHEIFQTSASGDQLTKKEVPQATSEGVTISLHPEKEFQTILGFGGSFTEASAYLLNRLGKENRQRILEAYFGDEGARYSLTRTHINSCDFSLSNYSFAPVEGDTALQHFSIEEDRDDIVPMIKEAMAISTDGFRIISSPWTAPPWMKDNRDWRGGKLLEEYYPTWALFFSKYLEAYKKEGIDIWAVTVENEPLGNSNNWESMHYTPEEMTDFVVRHLGPQLEKDGHPALILGYDQNRGEELKEWVDEMYRDDLARKYFAGTAIHWYASTYDHFPESLQYAHEAAPDKLLIQTEACVDAEVPQWRDDAWYWSKEATDWGWDWATEDQKYLHPKYVPVYRYARDIIGCLNNWVEGWVDWNMVLDRQGGPNWFKNWCVAPVIVDPDQDEVYFTPLYYTMAHFSRFIRPGAMRIGWECTESALLVTAVRQTDDLVVVIFNQEEDARSGNIEVFGNKYSFDIEGKALQTIVIPSGDKPE